MWKKIAPLLIVLSVALNAAFISVWAVHAARAYWPEQTAGGSKIWCPLHRQLNVTDEQWKRIEPRILEFRARAQTIRDQMISLRAELIDLIASDNPSPQAIAAKQEQMRTGREQMQKLVVDRLLAEKEVLTKEQQKQLFDMIRKRSACRGPGHMMGLPGMPPDMPTTSPAHSRAHSRPDQGDRQ